MNLLIGLLALGSTSQAATAPKAGAVYVEGDADKIVRVVARRQGPSVTLVAVPPRGTEATITLDATLQNVGSSRPLPLTVDAAGRREFELVRLAPLKPGTKWNYDFTFKCKYGARLAGDPARLPRVTYLLPYDPKLESKVIQGPLGAFSHGPGTGEEDAIDFLMPVGTPVLAARAGTVVGIRQDSRAGGPDPSFTHAYNYVLVKHDDGTFAVYVHLRPGGVSVRLGQAVAAGDRVGESGETGHTTRPHLHFVVFHNLDGKTRKTLPVEFRLKDGSTGVLREGKTY